MQLPWLQFCYHGDCLVTVGLQLLADLQCLVAMAAGQSHGCSMEAVIILVPCKDESIQIVITIGVQQQMHTLFIDD